MTQPEVLLEVHNLKKYFPVRGGILQTVRAQVRAVDDISFHIMKGETLGVVGESGCGKTTVGRTILRLTPPTAGKVVFRGRNLFEFGDHAGIGEVTTVQDQVDVTEGVGDTGRERGNVLADVRVADNPDAHDPGAGHER